MKKAIHCEGCRLVFIAITLIQMSCSSVERVVDMAEIVARAEELDVCRIERNEAGDVIRLNLSEMDINSDDLQGIKSLELLQVLELTHTEINDQAISYIVMLPNLVTLELSHTQISDVSLRALSHCERLTEIGVSNSQLTRESVEELRKALPDAYVYW